MFVDLCYSLVLGIDHLSVTIYHLLCYFSRGVSLWQELNIQILREMHSKITIMNINDKPFQAISSHFNQLFTETKLILHVRQSRKKFKVIKLFLCSTQLSMTFSLLINMKMPTIVDISIFISRKCSCSAIFSKKEFAIVSNLRFMSKINFMLSWGEHEKKKNVLL